MYKSQLTIILFIGILEINTIITNPKNIKLLKENLHEIIPPHPYIAFDYNRIEIRGIEWIPERILTERWVPTTDRFIELEEQDEIWAKKLGFGRIEYVDSGPLFYLIDASNMTFGNYNELWDLQISRKEKGYEISPYYYDGFVGLPKFEPKFIGGTYIP